MQHVNRREFLKAGTAAGLTAALPWGRAAAAAATPRPNVLWISAEDLSPDLGCYGDTYAVTPHLDALARQSVRCTNVYSHMGVCAPARSGIITGMYPTSMGTNPMRCNGVPPPEVRCFPELLRAAGYYCTNRSKTDYQFAAPPSAWDVCGGGGHWRGRAPGQPFFSVINLTTTHEGQIRNPGRREQLDRELTPAERHDPDRVTLPPYHPDTPLVRRDWAQYYDLITSMDREVRAILDQLERDGLAEDTIVWFWGDHGRGLPRCKRWIYGSGLHVPLLVRVPDKWRAAAGPDWAPGHVFEELVGFVDFAPTMLSLCGLAIPSHMQGRAFLGPAKSPEPGYLFSARDRVDETYDMIRGVRDRRFRYIRNFMPHLPRSQHISYMDQMPTMAEMRRLHAEGNLHGPQQQFFECPKPIEELYDCHADPHEVHNLAGDPAHASRLSAMREALFDWMARTRDTGLLPEAHFDGLKRPGDRMATTAAPGFSCDDLGDGRFRAAALCATPGSSIVRRRERPAPREDLGGIRLGIEAATIHGDGLQRTPDRGIIGWRDVRTWLSWEVELPRPGVYPVHVLSACNGRSGSRFHLQVGEAVLEGTVEETGGWYNHRFFRVGEVTIPTAGTTTVALKPQPQDRPYSMNLMAVLLGAEAPAAAEPEAPWLLYAAPVTLAAGETLTARACRLGFRDSPAVSWRVGDPPPEPAPTQEPPHWRTLYTDAEARAVLAFKRLQTPQPASEQVRQEALASPYASLRWWVLVDTLGLASGGGAWPAGWETVCRACLTDASPCVRIAAAQSLCRMGHADAGLPVLTRELEGNGLATGRLLAASALRDLGPLARPALDDVRRARDREKSYVNRVCAGILVDLEGAK
ncbi:MAG: sulfatase-like hydrolase/transferase [Lentisphaeria bacterium]|nr:sulfatase-like hydrolase/transferase [Lentisphaeria bacterium]